MSAQSVKAVQKRRKTLFKFAAIVLAACGVLFFVKQKKDLLVREGADFLQSLLSRETQLDVRVGSVSGRLTGVLRFGDVRLEDPGLPAGLRLIFRAKDVEVRFRPLDFLTKKYDSKLHLDVRGAEFIWRPSVSLRPAPLGLLRWAREWTLAQRRHLDVSVEDLKVVLGAEKREFSGIRLHFDDDAFSLTLPLRHMEALGLDVTTQLHVNGKFETGPLSAPDALTGRFFSEGTVLNWSPLPWEANFDFLLTEHALRVHSLDLLGGMEVDGGVDFTKDGVLALTVDTEDYPLRNFEPFMRVPKGSLEGRMDLKARLAGQWEAPNLEADVRILGGHTGPSRFRAMALHIAGVYPTLLLSDSHILLEDGSSMRLADTTVEFSELFSDALYHRLVSVADQNTVVVGDWEFKRPAEEGERPEFRMQRRLGKHAGMYIRKFNGPSEEKLDSPDEHEMQVGFEYRLKGKDTLKFEANEDEEFVGVERKLSF